MTDIEVLPYITLRFMGNDKWESVFPDGSYAISEQALQRP